MKQKVGNRIPNYPALCFLWFLKLVELIYCALNSFFQSIFSVFNYNSSRVDKSSFKDDRTDYDDNRIYTGTGSDNSTE